MGRADGSGGQRRLKKGEHLRIKTVFGLDETRTHSDSELIGKLNHYFKTDIFNKLNRIRFDRWNQRLQ